MDPEAEPLLMYGSTAEAGGLDWAWVDAQLASAAGYWIVAGTGGRPHPRPVWGVWHEHRLYLSIGSPTLKAQTPVGRRLTAHLGSVTDVVIVDAQVNGASGDPYALQLYNTKYDWDYTVDAYGPLTIVDPVKVIAWRSGGWAGREGFKQTGRWRFGPRHRSKHE